MDRIFVAKKDGFKSIEINLLKDLKNNLGLDSLSSLEVINFYEIENVDKEVLESAKKTLLAQINTDEVLDLSLEDKKALIISPLIGQFDQRADSTKKGLLLLGASEDVLVRTGIVYIFNDDLSEEDFLQIKKYLINPLEVEEYDFKKKVFKANIDQVDIVDDFIEMNEKELKKFLQEKQLSLHLDDLIFIQDYFKKIKRNPTITELLVLDTYWSDHCRHTTFEMIIEDIDLSESNNKEEIEEALKLYHNKKQFISGKPEMTLMDLASIQTKVQLKDGSLDNKEDTNEINACSIEVDVNIDGKNEKYLLMFKNETHNHPTEIEPYGGAATCIGGAIRDPLSGRAFVYQAMRISGAGNVLEKIQDTRANKLSQKNIALRSALGHSSYGNQIGVANTFVKEYYHPSYRAKKMELGVVVGAVKKDDILRAEPKDGDYVLLLGGATGRDGIGGASGSSKSHNQNSIEDAQSEVQKGNAPEERKIQRLFRNPQVTKLIKKANDFGAGGVSVAVGELADGLIIDLDQVPVKYQGLNGSELAISESQERMAVVIAPEDYELFKKLAFQENLEVSKIAIVQGNELIMKWQGEEILRLDREFLDSNGVAKKMKAKIVSKDDKQPNNDFLKEASFKKSVEKLVTSLEFADQSGLASLFDNSVGRSSVLANYGGKYQATMSEASVQKIASLDNNLSTASILSVGFNPRINENNIFDGAQIAVIESLARLVACGADYQSARLSLQEYFPKINSEAKYGEVVAAMLGALKAMHEFNVPALGGKDSMSGSFEELDVIPTLVSFAITTIDTKDVISNEFKNVDEYVYFLKSDYLDYDLIKDNFNKIYELNKKKLISSCSSIKNGGLLAELLNASYGNNIGVKLNDKLSLDELVAYNYGGFILTSEKIIEDEDLVLIGKTIADEIIYQEEVLQLKELFNKSQSVLEGVYPTIIKHDKKENDVIMLSKNKEKPIIKTKYSKARKENPVVFIPVFMGTNSEYDVAKAFEVEGAKVIVQPFIDYEAQHIPESIDRFVECLNKADILALSGGFSAADEPEGSGKYIVNILLNEKVQQAINALQEREGLIIGICNGFQALIKSGLLPYGKIGEINEKTPTLFYNQYGKHLARFVKTKVLPTPSPWSSQAMINQEYNLVISHGEGRLIGEKEIIQELFDNNQVFSQYVDEQGNPATRIIDNPNGSYASIEGLVSPDGRIIGKMAHNERYVDGLFQNIPGNKQQNIFKNAILYFRKEEY